MATLKLLILKSKKLKSGKHKIRIAVCHKQQTFYIVTRFTIDNESQFKDGQVVKRSDAAIINQKLRSLLNEQQEKLDSIKNISMYEPSQLKKILENKVSTTGSTTFQTLNASYVNELRENGKFGYAEMLERNGKYFTEYTKADIFLEDITPELIDGYSKFLRKVKKIGPTTNGIMMRNTKTIINRGIKKRLVTYSIHPFVDFHISSSPVRELDIPVETFNRIRMANPDRKRYKIARDLFCLSFYLGGINLIDLMNIDFKNTNEIRYTRIKTAQTKIDYSETRIDIPKEANEIIQRWINKRTGKLDFGYKFAYKNFSRYISRAISAFVMELGIKEKVVYYSARKSFAQYASDLGIPDNIIDYCLGHSDKKRGVIRFYSKVKKQQADAAIAKVIDYVNNPDKYEDYLKLKRDIMMMQV